MKNNLIKSISLAIIFCLSLYLSWINNRIFAQDISGDTKNKVEDLDKQIAELENKLADTQQQEKTLSGQISYMNNQIHLTELQTQEAQEKLIIISKDIETLISKIGKLETSLDKIAEILLNRVRETYIKNRIEGLEMLLSSNRFADYLSRIKYIKAAQTHDKKLMFQIQETKTNYEDQKKLLEEKKKEKEDLKVRLEGYKITLANQKRDKENLLEVTKNDEKNYQGLLSNLRAQKNSLLSAVLATGEIPTFKIWSGDDNYFNQTDSRWANELIGGFLDPSDPSYMWKYGCAVTSTAMVLTKMGIDIDPGRLAKSSIYFYDLIAWQKVPDIFSVNIIGNPYGSPNWDVIDQNLNEGRWVIVHVWAFTRNGHFIVIKSKEGDDYKIHDPYFGPNLMLNSKYGKSMVDQMTIFQKR